MSDYLVGVDLMAPRIAELERRLAEAEALLREARGWIAPTPLWLVSGQTPSPILPRIEAFLGQAMTMTNEQIEALAEFLLAADKMEKT